MFVPYDLADALCANQSAGGIFYADDMPAYVGLHVAVFKREVGVLHFAVFKRQALRVAQRLRADDFAVDKRQIFGIPPQIFAFYNAVFHGDIFPVPKSVLGVQHRVRNPHVLRVLERVFAFHVKMRHFHIPAVHERIFRGKLAVFHVESAAEPAKLPGINLAVLQGRIVALAQRLNAAQAAGNDMEVFVVPQRGAAGFGHGAVFQRGVVRVPQRVAQTKARVRHADAARFF